MNHQQAYVLGLLVGGGRLDSNLFTIDLPYKKWGEDPKRMGKIAKDILTKIRKIFKESYNLDITYELGNGKWLLKPLKFNNLSKVKSDLNKLGLPTTGIILQKADLEIAKQKLKGILAESFLSGIFDARASIAKSHRRFTENAPVVSIEIPGSTQNFKFVVQMCSWLTDLGSTTDQILYNHPNQHAGKDPFYKGWKKGFKIRFLVKSFLAEHSFALQTKSIDAEALKRQQNKKEQHSCPFRKIKNLGLTVVHNDQKSKSLPNDVKGKLFFHYFHYCAVLGCKHAPLEEVKRLVSEKEKYISFFPVFTKGEYSKMNTVFNKIHEEYFKLTTLSKINLTTKEVLNHNFLKNYSNIQPAIAYLFSKELNGKRHKGNMKNIIEQNLSEKILITSLNLTNNEPIMLYNSKNERACVLSNRLSVKNLELIQKHTLKNGLNIELK